MKKRTVYVFVFEGFADWEAAYAMTGINLSNEFVVRTIALEKKPLRSMGGMTILPDVDFFPRTDLNDIDDTNTAMLILPGGPAWEEHKEGIIPLIEHCYFLGIPVAAICGDTVMHIFDLLGIENNAEIAGWFGYFKINQ